MGMNTYSAVTAERSRPYRIVSVAAVLMAAVAVGVMFVANASNRPQPTGGLPVRTTTAAVAPPAGANQAAFTCAASSAFTGKQPPLSAYVDGVRTGTHTRYDRLTVEFKNGQPGSITIRPQAGTTFNQSPSGQSVTLAGRNGILVVMRGADAHTVYGGLRDITTSYPGLVEVRLLEDFEGQVSLGLGVSQSACYRASMLADPVRLVIDIQVG